MRGRLFDLARRRDDSPFARARLDEVVFADGHIRSRAESARSLSLHDIDVIFVDERDAIVNPLGAKGLGDLPRDWQACPRPADHARQAALKKER